MNIHGKYTIHYSYISSTTNVNTVWLLCLGLSPVLSETHWKLKAMKNESIVTTKVKKYKKYILHLLLVSIYYKYFTCLGNNKYV